MGLAHSPRIVTNGLVLCLDAGNTKSYPGSGTTWTDMIGKRSTTLVNGPTFSSSNGGSIVFDGVNDYATASIPTLTDYSLSFWIYIISGVTGEKQILGANGGGAEISLLNGSWISYSQLDGGVRSGPAFSLGVWYNFIMTRTGSTTNFVINNIQTNTFASGSNVGIDGTAVFGDLAAGFGRYLNANIARIDFYNRVLTTNELTQNFNALRGRFGI